MSTDGVDVIVVRHSERLDEVDASAWKRAVDENKGRSCFKYDPVISPREGIQYAREVATSLKALTASESRTVVIFASKLLRAAQTASYIAHELGVGVHLSAGLAQIIPAVKNCREGFEFADVNELQRRCCPEVEFIDCDHTTSSYAIPTGSWRTATADIIRRCQREGCLPIIVAHRESVRKIAGEHLQTPYCCLGLFHLAGSSTALPVDEKKVALEVQCSSEGRSGGATESAGGATESADAGLMAKIKYSRSNVADGSLKPTQPELSSGSGKVAPAASSGAMSLDPAASAGRGAVASHSVPTATATAQSASGSKISRMSAAGAAGGIVRCGTRDPTGHKAGSNRPRPGSDRPRAGATGPRAEAKDPSNRGGGGDGSSGVAKADKNEIIAQLRLIAVLDRDGSPVPQK